MLYNSSWLFLFQGQSIDDVPSAIIDDAAQLVKANSISGNKINDIDVVYTMWQNLKKTDGMEAGQVAFHKEKEVRFKKCRICLLMLSLLLHGVTCAPELLCSS